MSDYLKIGHLSIADESKIANVPVTNAQIIHSEKSGMQFVDYNNKRHTQGSVISGIYNDSTKYTDFATSTVDNVLTTIKANGFIVDGQLIKVGDSIYKYRKIGGKNFLTKLDEYGIDVSASKVGFAIYLPNYTSGDTVDVDIVVSIYNSTHNNKLFLVKIVNGAIDLNSCEDLDGEFDSSLFDLNIVHNSSVPGLFTIGAKIASKINIVSYSVKSTGSSESDALYIVASDL